MEAEMVPSLTPLLQRADEWSEVLLLLPLLVALEAVLSADNAIALAAISRRLHDPERQRQALNLGLLLALVLRMALIVAARWVLDAWPLQLAAAAYLLWLCGRHLLGLDEGGADGPDPEPAETFSPAAAVAGPATGTAGMDGIQRLPVPLAAEPHGSGPRNDGHGSLHGHSGPTLASIALTLALTDLAFSLDSVAAAVAVTDRLALVMAGGLLGVLALRLTAGLFVRWLEVFSRLETAGYLAVGLVGIRLLLRLLLPDLEVPEWVLLLLVSSLFLWGFSQRSSTAERPDEPVVAAATAAAVDPAPADQPLP
jgi:YkoY family integral membrane protein